MMQSSASIDLVDSTWRRMPENGEHGRDARLPSEIQRHELNATTDYFMPIRIYRSIV